MKPKVSFDFDGTMTAEKVQSYLEELSEKGDAEIWVTTARSAGNRNEDLRLLVAKYGIPMERVIFTDMKWKAMFLKANKFVWHLDDNSDEYIASKHFSPQPVVIITGEMGWRNKCNKLLDLAKFNILKREQVHGDSQSAARKGDETEIPIVP